MSSFVKASGGITPMSADPGEEFPFLHTITVVDRVVSVDKPELVQNNIKTETVTLNLDSEWEGLSTVINIGNEKPVSVIWSGEPVVIPAELMTTVGSLDVSVVGYGDDGGIRAVTKQAKSIFNVVASGFVEGDEAVPDPTTVLGQLIQAADNANKAADRFNQASDDIGKVETSATNAKESETNASESAQAAKTSETNAATSATAAATSETNAAASATAAQNAVDNFGLEAGTTTTGDPGTDAVVNIVKDGTRYRANFTIPRGEQGEPGVSGINSVLTDSTLTGDGTSAKKLGIADGFIPKINVILRGGTSADDSVDLLGSNKVGFYWLNGWYKNLPSRYCDQGINKGTPGVSGITGYAIFLPNNGTARYICLLWVTSATGMSIGTEMWACFNAYGLSNAWRRMMDSSFVETGETVPLGSLPQFDTRFQQSVNDTPDTPTNILGLGGGYWHLEGYFSNLPSVYDSATKYTGTMLYVKDAFPVSWRFLSIINMNNWGAFPRFFIYMTGRGTNKWVEVAFQSDLASYTPLTTTTALDTRVKALEAKPSGGLASVAHDETLTGDGTAENRLSVAEGSIPVNAIIIDGGNLDDAQIGFTDYTHATNAPNNAAGVLLRMTGGINQEYKDIAFTSYYGAAEYYARVRYKGKWNGWEKFVMTSDLSSYVPLSTYQALEARVQALEAKLANQ